MEKKLSGSRQALRHILSIIGALFVVINHLTSSLLGLLVLVLSIYLIVPLLSNIEFWTLRETAAWGLSLPPDTLLTAAGIVAAYAIAVSTWRQQKTFEIRLSSAWTVAQFLYASSDESKVISRFAEQLYQTKDAMAGGTVSAKAKAQVLLDRRNDFLEARASLARRAVDIHALRGRFEAVVAGSFAPDMALIAAEKGLAGVTTGMWFPIPYAATTPSEVLAYIADTNDAEWRAFELTADKAVPAIEAGASGLIAVAQGRLFKPTLWAMLRTWRRAKIFMAE